MFPFTDEDLQEPVNNIIEKKISPMLARDGGAINHIPSDTQTALISNKKILISTIPELPKDKILQERELYEEYGFCESEPGTYTP